MVLILPYLPVSLRGAELAHGGVVFWVILRYFVACHLTVV